ncbi:MAG: hypothetical protein Q9213_002525 [Squamulea squamosa]
MSEQTLSKRGQRNLPNGSSLAKIIQVLTYSYGDNNPHGMSVIPCLSRNFHLLISSSVSLGVAENGLMHEELASLLTYGDGPFGSRALRSALSSYFNDYFHPVHKVTPDQLLIAGGATSIIDLVTVGVADEGDGILIGRPLYTSFAKDVSARAGSKMIPVSAEHRDPMSEEMVEQYEKELQKQEKAAHIIRLSINTLKAYMRFCHRHKIHLISDEVYAMSIYKTPSSASAVPFTSALAIDTTNLIDPNLIHIVYGMSKDFSSNGLRCGVLLSQSNPSLLASLRSIAMFSWPTSTTEFYWTTLLNDRSFLNDYFAENSRRLAAGYERMTSFFTANNIKWAEGSNAGFFLWADFRGVLGDDIIVNNTTEETGEEQVEALTLNDEKVGQVYKTSKKAKARDEWFFGKLMEAKVFIASGDAFFAEEHGWYRVTFSVPEKVLEVGLERLGRVLEEVGKENDGSAM